MSRVSKGCKAKNPKLGLNWRPSVPSRAPIKMLSAYRQGHLTRRTSNSHLWSRTIEMDGPFPAQDCIRERGQANAISLVLVRRVSKRELVVRAFRPASGPRL